MKTFSAKPAEVRRTFGAGTVRYFSALHEAQVAGQRAVLGFVKWRVVADGAAHAVAARNVRKHGLGRRIRLVRSDLFENLKARYDLIRQVPARTTGERVDLLNMELDKYAV